jgi:hypothetical protein
MSVRAKVGERRHICCFHPSQPRLQAGRIAAAGRHVGAGARRVPGSRAVAGMPLSNRSGLGEMGLLLRSGASGSIKSPARPFNPWGESWVD